MAARSTPAVHQDFIARIRYSNTLPPPPNPPRLLDIPNTGLAGGQYTQQGFASRLAREQPLNIEADAELGMPLDLVGMPGIFDGDESSIQAPLQAPPIHAHDRALLRPLTALGKPKIADTNVSFLRRSEYITAWSGKTSRFESSSSNPVMGKPRRQRPRNVDRESPEFIKGQIAKSFDIAASNLKDRSRVVHPSKRNLKLVEAYPVIPDLDAMNEVGGYIEIKFGKHPALKDTYDTRLETALLRPLAFTDAQNEQRERMMEAYTLDPVHNPKPPGAADYDFELFLTPESSNHSDRFKRRFDPDNMMRNDDSLYPAMFELRDGSMVPGFKYLHVRTYETVSQKGGLDSRYDEKLALSIENGERDSRPKAAYYYPIVSRLQLDPRRQINMAKKLRNQELDEVQEKTDVLEVRIEDAQEELIATRAQYAPFQDDEGEEENGAVAAQDDDEDGHHEPDDEVSQEAVVPSIEGANGVEDHSQS